jgi:hypothetical protein
MEGGSTLFVGISAASAALLAIFVSLSLPRLSAGMRLSLVVLSSVGEAFRFPPRAGMLSQPPCRRYELGGTKQFKQRTGITSDLLCRFNNFLCHQRCTPLPFCSLPTRCQLAQLRVSLVIAHTPIIQPPQAMTTPIGLLASGAPCWFQVSC